MDTEEIINARKDAHAFLAHHKTGVLATVSAEGIPHASMIYYTVEDTFDIYFLTLINSRKFEALQAHPRVAFTVATPEMPQTLQIEGMAMDISLDEEVAKKKEKLLEVLNSNAHFPGPITRLDPAEVVVVWIRPLWIRWADYAFEQAGSSHVFKEIPLN